MKAHRILLVPALILAAAAAPGHRPADPLSRTVAAIVADIRPDDSRATPARVARGIRIVDADGDGISDYLFSLEAISYPGWCGTGGCRTQLWLGRRGAAPRKVFDAQVRETSLRTQRHRRVFEVDLHGSACYTFGADACPASFVWDPGAGRMVEHANSDGSRTIRLLRPVETLDRSPPPAVRARLDALAADCRAAGGTAESQDSALTVPDIDGDGLRDWLIAYLYCASPDEREVPQAPMILFASSAGPAEALVASQIEIRVEEPVSAVFKVESEDCRRDDIGTPPCPRIPLRWDSPTRRFLPR